MMPSTPTQPGTSKAQFREQWERARVEVALLIAQGARAMGRLDSLYGTTLGEEAPEWAPPARERAS